MRFSALIPLFLLPASLIAEVTLAPLFQDGAVFQQGKTVPVWGKAAAGEKVTVEFKGQTKTTSADTKGAWRVNLDSLPVSADPAEMTITGTNTIKVGDILVGEVWICSGQSNMAFPVSRANNFTEESTSATNPLIRQFKVALSAAEQPQETLKGSWVACSPATVGDFTAVGYFFGREINKSLNVPIGLINTSYGGTPIEAWTKNETLKSDPAFAPVFERWQQNLDALPELTKKHEALLARWQADRKAALAANKEFKKRAPAKPAGPGSRLSPSGLFNAMVHPLIPYAIRGVIWYQGEANAQRFGEYPKFFSAMITSWRKDFDQGDVPFYFVQLANLERRVDLSRQIWAFQREAQATALKLPNTGMAVAVDIGESGDIHPKNKQEVGRRLSLIALALTYEKGGEYAGPLFQSASSEGAKMRIQLDHAKGLKLINNGAGFELAGADKIFHPATMEIDGESLIASSPAVSSPVAVRYAWMNDPGISLYNGQELPAPPFRSDNWAPPASPLSTPTQAETQATPE